MQRQEVGYRDAAAVGVLSRCCTAFLPFALATAAPAVPASDPQHDGTRALLENAYLDEYQQNPAIYQNSPVNLIVPTFKNVTFAVAADSYNRNLTSTDFGSYYVGPKAEQRLYLTGYTFAPYIAVSLHRIGLGFSAERGARKVQYHIDDASQPDSPVSFARQQSSAMFYNAVGVYVYLLPFESTGEGSVVASLVVGAKDYNVTHYVTPITGMNQPLFEQKFRYNLTQYEVGSLVEYRILKKFSLIPWIDYNYIDIHDPINQADAIINHQEVAGGIAGDGVDTAYCLKGDTMMFWRARPKLSVGLDMVASILDIKIHLGDALGYLITTRSNRNLVDKSFTVSLSVNMKAD